MKKFYIILIIVAIAAGAFWRVSAQIIPPVMPPGNTGCVGGSPNGKCETAESRNSCISDCAGISSGNGSCGNSQCDIPNDLLGGCVSECGGGSGGGNGSCQGGGLGNGICEGTESISGCPFDCECNNDKKCDPPKENKNVCPADCGCNHNGICEKNNSNGFNETTGSCTDDCGWTCTLKRPYYSNSCNDNGICEVYLGENFTSCKKDCGLIYKKIDRGNAVQNINDCNTIINADPNSLICNYDGKCGSAEQNCPDCTTRSGTSGTFDACNNNGICESNERGEACCDCSELYCNHNGVCENQTNDPLGNGTYEDSLNCPDDCPNYCNSNKIREAFWKATVCDYSSIPANCYEEVTTTPQFQGFAPKLPIFTEDSTNCRNDVPCNNNGICEPNFHEDSSNCSDDCSGVDCTKSAGDFSKISRCDQKALQNPGGYTDGPFNCKLNPPAGCNDNTVPSSWLQTGCNFDGICQPGACEGVGNCPDCDYLCGDGKCSHGAGSMKLTDEEGKEITGITYINWKVDKFPDSDKGTLIAGENPSNCYKDCYIGDRTNYLQTSDKICNWKGDGGAPEPETTDNSPIDCECNANGVCDPWEGPKNCRSDCVCNNNGICESGGIALPDKPTCDDSDLDPTKHCGECYKGVYIHYPSYPGKISSPPANSGSVANFGAMSYGGSHWAMDVFALPCWRQATGTIIISSKLGSLMPKEDCFSTGASERFFEAAKQYCQTKDFGLNLRLLTDECKNMAFPWYFSAPNNEAGVVTQNDFTYGIGKCSLSKEIPYYCNGETLFTYQEYSCPVRGDEDKYYPGDDFSRQWCPGFEGALRSFKDTARNVYSLGELSYVIADNPQTIKTGNAAGDYDKRLPSINLADYLYSLKKNQCVTGQTNPCDNDGVCESGENFYNCYYDCACPAIRNYQFGFIYQPRGCLSVKEKPWNEQKAGCRKDCGSCGDNYCQKEESNKYSITLIPQNIVAEPAASPPKPLIPIPPCAGGPIEYRATRASDDTDFICGRVSLSTAVQIKMLCQNCGNGQQYFCDNFGNATGTCDYSVSDGTKTNYLAKLNYSTVGGNKELVYKEEAWCAPGESTCLWKKGENIENCSGDCMMNLGVETLSATSVTPYSADLRMKITGWGVNGTPGEYWFEYWEADTDLSQAGEQQQTPRLVTGKFSTDKTGTTTINVANLKNDTKYYFQPYVRSKFGSPDADRDLKTSLPLSFTTLLGKCGTIIIDSPKNNAYVYPDESTEIKWHYEPLASGDSGCDNHFRMQILDGNNLEKVIDVTSPNNLPAGTFKWGDPNTNDRPYQIRIIGYSASEDDMTNPTDLSLIVPKLPVLSSWWASGSGLCYPGSPYVNFGFDFASTLSDNARGLVATFKLYNVDQLSILLYSSDVSGRQTGVWDIDKQYSDSDQKYFVTASVTWHGENIDVPLDSNSHYYKEVSLDDHNPPTVGFETEIDATGKLNLHAFPYPPPDSNPNISEIKWYLNKEDFQSDPKKNAISDSIDGMNDWWLMGQNTDLLKTGIWLEAFDSGSYSCSTSTLPDNSFREVHFKEKAGI